MTKPLKEYNAIVSVHTVNHYTIENCKNAKEARAKLVSLDEQPDIILWQTDEGREFRDSAEITLIKKLIYERE